MPFALVLAALLSSVPPPAGAPDLSGPDPIAALARALPDHAGRLAAGKLERGDGYARRRYTRGKLHIEVTLARMPMADAAWQSWVRQSAAYPQASLGLTQDEASAFYSCDGAGAAERCDLHGQLRAGVHVELMGGGSATRADLDALVRELGLARLAR